MAAVSGGRVTDECVKCLRIFADANGETHMEDVDIALPAKKAFQRQSSTAFGPVEKYDIENG